MKCTLVICTQTDEHCHTRCKDCGAEAYGNMFCLSCRDWWAKKSDCPDVVDFLDRLHRALLAARPKPNG